MSGVVSPTPAPNVELELAKLANDAIAAGADPHDTTAKLHDTLSYLRKFPEMAQHATNALADGVATPADISRTLWPHVEGYTNSQKLPGINATPSGSEPDVGLMAAAPRALAATGANIASGIPGMTAVQAFIRSKTRGQSYTDALSDVRGAEDKIPTALRIPEKIAGAVTTAPLLPAGAVAGGATLGAADAALAPDPESLGERAMNTVVGAGVGAGTGLLTKGAGNVAQRSGATDMIGKFLANKGGAAGDVGQAMGTRGAANSLLQTRQDILDRLPGSDQSAAQTMIDHADAYKAKASQLYDAARQDRAPINDPRVQALVQDPAVQRAYDWAQKVFEAGGGKVPQKVLAPATPAGAPQLTLPAVSGYQPTSLVPATTAGAPAQAAQVMDLPNPEILSLTKRFMQDFVDRGMSAPGVTRAEAAAVLPKLDALRSVLHDVSPAWKDADAYYAQAKNFEDVFQKSYGAQLTPSAAALNPSKLRTPQAVADFVAKKQGTSIGDARAAGAQAGAAAKLAEAVKSQSLPTTVDQLTAAAPLQSSENAAALRRPAFPSDNAAQSFTDLLAKVNAQGQRDASSFGPTELSAAKPWQMFTRALSKPNPLATPAGTQLRMQLSTQLDNPAIRAQLLRSAAGRELLTRLGKMSGAAVNASVLDFGGYPNPAQPQP